MRQPFFRAKTDTVYWTMYNREPKEAIDMKQIDIVQAQQDIQFIYNCYKHFGLDVDECRAVLKDRDCCEHRDSDGQLLFDEASSRLIPAVTPFLRRLL